MLAFDDDHPHIPSNFNRVVCACESNEEKCFQVHEVMRLQCDNSYMKSSPFLYQIAATIATEGNDNNSLMEISCSFFHLVLVVVAINSVKEIKINIL